LHEVEAIFGQIRHSLERVHNLGAAEALLRVSGPQIYFDLRSKQQRSIAGAAEAIGADIFRRSCGPKGIAVLVEPTKFDSYFQFDAWLAPWLL